MSRGRGEAPVTGPGLSGGVELYPVLSNLGVVVAAHLTSGLIEQ